MVVDVVVETVASTVIVVDAVVESLTLLIVTVLENAERFVRLVTVRLMERVALLMMSEKVLSLVVKKVEVLLRVLLGMMKEVVTALMVLMI